MSPVVSAWSGVRLAVLLAALVQVVIIPVAPVPGRYEVVYWLLVAVSAVLLSGALILEVQLWPPRRAQRYALLVGAATIAAVACKWSAVLVGQPGGLRTFVTMISAVVLVLVFLVFRDQTRIAASAGVLCLLVGVVLGSQTGIPNWPRAAVPPVILSLLAIVALATVAVRGMVYRIDQLADLRSYSQERAHRQQTARTRRNARMDRIDRHVRPVLERVAAGEEFDDDDLVHARLLERQLRDGIRAPSLSVPPVIEAVREARLRGVSVTLLDDRGLDVLPDDEREAVFDRVSRLLVGELSALGHGELTARLMPPGRAQLALITVHSSSGTRVLEIGRPGESTDRSAPSFPAATSDRKRRG